MVRKETVSVAFMASLLLVASFTICAHATEGPRMLASEKVYYPQGCRCCFFVGRIPNMRCGKVCCTSIRGENCCIGT
ncbi:hypothetical protein POPTR_016G002900v4 [Populus trichocarpa]|uniref:Uncharacterized protein n=1 Tax=Populus trichocarpa TaxID=3694 RepID=A0A2K1X8K9_POPTR|nr:hypothetical protein BDE02_16G002700 [Populus trichocarpa]PNS97109.1 hypothetical protein POPTR_016G002900v4 [Populus trichocarpa]